MAPASHDPYAPANKRPRREGIDRPEVAHEEHPCLVCVALADAGLADVDQLPEHLPAQHIGDESGDVILSVEVPASALTLTDDAFPIRWTAEWWQKWTPDGVEPLHVASRETPIPSHIEEGIRAAGGTYRELSAMDAWWNRLDDDDRSSADAYAAEFGEEDWGHVLAGWRDVLARVEAGELSYDEAEFWPGDVGTSFVAGLAEGLAEGTAEWRDLGPVPDGHVRVGFSRDDVDTGPDGEPMGYGMQGDVPTDAKAAVAFLTATDDGNEPSVDRIADNARLVLTAELTRAPSARRTSVLAAVAEVLPPAEVEERTRQVDAPEQIAEGPTDGDSAGG